MSYDRVLPKPPGLYYDFSGRDLPIRTNTLWNHSFTTSRLDRDPFAQHGHQLPVHPESNTVTATATHTAIPDFDVGSEKTMTDLAAVLAPPITRRRVSSIALPELARAERAASASSSKSTSSRDSSSGPFCLCKPDPKIPRPRNAFILFRQHFQAAVVEQNPGLANPEISKIIGEKWRSLPAESKQDWKNLAEEEKARHQQQYPDYRYQPRRYGRKGNSTAASGSGISNNPTGASSCNKCGGRFMNPPPTPTTPFTPTVQTHDDSTVSSRSSRLISSGINGRVARKGTRSVSPRQLNLSSNWGVGDQSRYSDDNGLLSPEVKRRRCSFFPIRRDVSLWNGYPSHSAPFTIRPESLQPKIAHGIDAFRSCRIGTSGQTVLDPSLILPPLQTLCASKQSYQSQVEAMIMSIPFIIKIRELAEISPPFKTTKPAETCRGAVIAVEGQNAGSVQCVLQHLKSVLSSQDGQDVRVFKGPDLNSFKPSARNDDKHDSTMQYLETMSTWHRISNEIIHFISGPLEHSTGNEKASTEASPQKSTPTATQSLVPAPTDSTFRIAMVPQYQLSTADAHACATPINDAYAPIDHWRWTATPLWRGCVGPDITIYVRDCDREELANFGEGNPVEIRLDDAQTLVVRRVADSPDLIEEKALRRIGFEVEEFLRR